MSFPGVSEKLKTKLTQNMALVNVTDALEKKKLRGRYDNHHYFGKRDLDAEFLVRSSTGYGQEFDI
jgi:hypothetical protein